MRHYPLVLLALPFLVTKLAADGCGTTDPPADCERPAAAADRVRHVVISHPYDAAGKASPEYEVLELSTAGQLSTTGLTFKMGRSSAGRIVFTPDGKVGLVVQEDGTIGAFHFNDQGGVDVAETAFKGDFYATSLLMDPTGQRAWVLDGNWRENGGGIYAVHIYCDGSLADEGLFAPAKLPYAMEYIPGGSGDALLAATDVLSSPANDDAHRLNLSDPIVLEDGADAFGDNDAIVASMAVTFDGRFGLIGDNNLFSGTGDRVAVVGLDGMTPTQVLTSIEDPVGLLASPYNNAALVVSGFGDALFALKYAPTSATPFTLKGALTYVGSRPQLPGAAVMIEQGSLTGLALLPETSGVRRVQFKPDGSIVDLGLFSLGSGYTAIPGSLGVEP